MGGIYRSTLTTSMWMFLVLCQHSDLLNSKAYTPELFRVFLEVAESRACGIKRYRGRGVFGVSSYLLLSCPQHLSIQLSSHGLQYACVAMLMHELLKPCIFLLEAVMSGNLLSS